MAVIVRSLKNYQVEILSGQHSFISDEPAEIGDDAGPDPYVLLLASLGACTVITLHMYARRKQWPLEKVEVSLSTYRMHARDCEDCISVDDARVDIIENQLSIFGPLSEEQRARLAEIAERCPVHRSLTGEIKIRTHIVPEVSR